MIETIDFLLVFLDALCIYESMPQSVSQSANNFFRCSSSPWPNWLQLVANDMAHKSLNYGTSKVQGASVIHHTAEQSVRNPTSQEAICINSTLLSLTRQQSTHTVWSKNTLQTSQWLLSGHTVFSKPQAGKLTQIEKLLQICKVTEWLDKHGKDLKEANFLNILTNLWTAFVLCQCCSSRR